MVATMKAVFTFRGYEADCAPRATEAGRFAAQVVFTKIGYHPEASYRTLGEFDTEEAAIEHARQFAQDWLSRKA
ncbi:gp36-related protein [Burkholderia sp. lig30]|nr:gp36-related protein [Burkholderia sp. lig30]